MKRVVLDTNVLLIAISQRTDYYAIWRAFQTGAFELCVTTDILDEYIEKLEEKFRPEVGINIMKAIENSPDVIEIHKYYFWNLISVDPDDNKFVDCAIAANADFFMKKAVEEADKVCDERNYTPELMKKWLKGEDD